MALATTDDVQIAIGRDLSADELERAEQLLESASTAVFELTNGYRFEPGTYTVGRTARDGKVKLPAKVDSVDAVRSINPLTGEATDVTDFTSRGATVYGLHWHEYVEVDFTVARIVPADIVSLVAGVVAALMDSPQAGVTSELVGPYQTTFGNNSGRIFFSASDKIILRRYRVAGSAIRLRA